MPTAMPPLVTTALWQSLQIALIALALATPLAVLLARWMTRSRWRGRWLLDALILLPMGLPPAALGMALLIGLEAGGPLALWWQDMTGQHWAFYPGGALLAACCMTVPLMTRVLRPAFEAADPMMLPLARTLGANRWWAFVTVTLPLIAPAIASAVAMGLTAAWGECGAALVLAAAWQPPGQAPADTAVAQVQALLTHQAGPDAALHLGAAALLVSLCAMLVAEWGRQRWRRQWLATTALPTHHA